MSPKWFHRVRELFQDGFVGGAGANLGARECFAGGATPSVRKALKKLGKYRDFA
jgi:hypothetical protein